MSQTSKTRLEGDEEMRPRSKVGADRLSLGKGLMEREG